MGGTIQIDSLLIVFLALFGVRSGFEIVLNHLNIRYTNQFGRRIPQTFRGRVRQEELAKMCAYTVDSGRFGLTVSLFHQALTLAILLSGFLPWWVRHVRDWVSLPVGQGMVFFALLWVIYSVPQMPFSLYETFVIEERYGFNTKTLRVWFLDLLKETAITALLGGIVLSVLLVMIHSLGGTWWIWAWVVLGAFEGLVLWLYPVVIAPWFNRFEPIEDETLDHRIRRLMKKAGLRVEGVFQMDAGKRTRHTNAYVTGLSRTKRIVLFDSLLHAHPREEILAILSHEAGHWKKGHLAKHLAVTEALSLLGLFAVAKLLGWPALYRTFGFPEPVGFVGLFLSGILLGLVAYFSRPLLSIVSRRFERQADETAVELMGSPAPVTEALRRLAIDNLANLSPHPLYAWFHYSHPPVVERIKRLEESERRQTHP